MNQPKHAGRERLGDVIGLALGGRADVLTLKRIEREMQACLDRNAANPEIFWLVLGFVAFLRGQTDECVRSLQASIKLAPYDVVVLGNSGSILASIGEPRRAIDQARTLAEAARDDRDQTMLCAQILWQALCFEEALDTMERQSRSEESLAVPARRLVELARSHHVSVDLRLALLEAAVQVLRSHGHPVRQTALRHYPDDALRYELFIDAGAATCGDMNFQIAETLVEEFADPHPEFVTFACRPLISYTFEGSYVEVAR